MPDPKPALLKRLYDLSQRPLLRNIAKVAVGNIGGNVLNLATILLLGRHLQAEYGVLGTLQTVMLLVSQLADFGLNLTLVKYYREECDTRNNPEGAEALLRALFWLRLVIVGVMIAIGMSVAGPIAGRIDLAQHVGLFRLACAGAVANSLWMFAQAAMQAREQFTEYAVQTFANHALRLVLIGGLWWAGRLNVATSFAVIIIVPLAGALACMWRWPAIFWRAKFKAVYIRGRVIEIFHFSKWIFTSFLLATISTHAGTIQIAHLTNTAEVAIYRMAEQLAQGITLLTAAICTVLLPRLASIKNPAQMRRLFRAMAQILPILVLVGFIGYYSTRWVLPQILGVTFSPSIPVFGMLMTMHLSAVIINPLSYICYSFGKSNWITAMNLIQTVAYLASNQYLITQFGAIGPAYAGLITHAIAFCSVSVFSAILYRHAQTR